MGHKKLIAAGGIALFCAVGGAAYAASSSSFVGPHGNINGCVATSGGELNIWKPGHNCSGGRVNVAFPVRGQGGPAGATGATGITGATGATGATNPSATTVDGETATKLLLKEPTPATGMTTLTLYNANGLTILAECDNAGNASLQANGPSSADSVLTVSGFQSGGTGYFGSQTSALGPASAASLGPPSAGETSFSYASSSGQTVSGDIGYQKSPSFGTFNGCAFFGTVMSG